MRKRTSFISSKHTKHVAATGHGAGLDSTPERTLDDGHVRSARRGSHVEFFEQAAQCFALAQQSQGKICVAGGIAIAHNHFHILANALGVPLLALFGPTNPVRTGPVFTAPTRLLQPPGCPLTGGGQLADLTPESVAAALRELLASPLS